jgi:hypothetical protein
MATVSNDESNISYNPQDWLALSGKKLERYYYKSQNSTTFKLPSKKSTKKSKTNKVSKSSGDCPPMINPEEIKITIFEYPKDGNYTPQRPAIKHIQSVNPYLTATNMLDALKLVIEGKEKSKTSSTTTTTTSPEIEAVEQEVTRLTQQKMQLEKEIDALEKQLESGPQSGGGKFRVRDVLLEEIENKKRQLKQVNITLASAMRKLEELKLKDTKSQMATSSTVKYNSVPPPYENVRQSSSNPVKVSPELSSAKNANAPSSLSSTKSGLASRLSGATAGLASKVPTSTSDLASRFSGATAGLTSKVPTSTSDLASRFSGATAGLAGKLKQKPSTTDLASRFSGATAGLTGTLKNKASTIKKIHRLHNLTSSK